MIGLVFCTGTSCLTLEGIRGVGVKLTPPPRFFGFKLLLLNRLPKALVQLFFVR